MEANDSEMRWKRRSREQINELLAAYQESGQTQSEFCRQQGLSVATFSSWRRKYHGQAEGRSVGFCEVRLKGGAGAESTAIRLTDGTEVFLAGGLSPVRVAEYVAALRRLC